jgi:DNA polymerase-3 subunit epsilon/DNA polymerase-3 subunit alpha (Gram-positive type)
MNVLVLDCEYNQPSGKTIQIGAAAFKASTGELLGTFETFVNPGEVINPEIVDLTGITDEDVINAPSIKEAYKMLESFKKKHKCFMNPIVWGSGSRNDSNIIWMEAYPTQADRIANPNFMGHRVIDAKVLYQSLQVYRNKTIKAGLQTACEKLGITFEGRAHTALSDAINTFKVWFELTKMLDRGEKEAKK